MGFLVLRVLGLFVWRLGRRRVGFWLWGWVSGWMARGVLWYLVEI